MADVLILGGGLAGCLLALQLRRDQPALHVTVVERRATPARKVGESTSELGTRYLEGLGLRGLLEREHVPKRGLRVLFDREGGGATLSERSAVFTPAPPAPGFQIDRARLEASLLDQLVASGVTLLRGWRAEAVTIGRPHAVTITRDGERRTLTGRWLVDASGRARLLARQLGLHEPVSGHELRASWGWTRALSPTGGGQETVQLNYPEGWLWRIPLGGGLTSLGVVWQRASWRRAWGTPDGLAAMARARGLLAPGDASRAGALEGFGGAARVAVGSRRLLSPARWALIGDAGAFTDPLFSPGLDSIAVQAELLGMLIARDISGEALKAPLEAAEAWLQHRHRLGIALYRGLYAGLGSYDLFRLAYAYSLHSYYNRAALFERRRHLEPGWLRAELRRGPRALAAVEELSETLRALATKLREEGGYFRGNASGHTDGAIDESLRSGLERSPSDVALTQLRLHRAITREARAWLAGDAPPTSGWITRLGSGEAHCSSGGSSSSGDSSSGDSSSPGGS